jgi:glycosyltransferase involved in cell wall biosynthesis
MIKLLALTKYSYEGPSSRYRFYNYKESFAKNNIEMTIKPLFDKYYFNAQNKWQKAFVAFICYIKRLLLVLQLLVLPKKYDLVLLEYELFPYCPAWFEYLFVKRGVQYVVDYDDAIFHKYDRHSNAIVRSALEGKIAKVMGYAQTVIVCNAYLEEYASKYNEHIVTMPTVVLLDKYVEKMKNHLQRDADDFVIGWIGSWTTGIYVLDIFLVMKKFVQKYDNVRFHLVGFDEKLLSEQEREEAHIEVITWSEAQEIEHILDFDIGIMPLPDDKWSRGKCGFKLVQYMSCKKPVIASAVGVNCALVEEGVNGLLVDSSEAWFEAFEKLYLDDTLRDKMVQNNFKKIEKEYNNKIYSQRYIELLKNTLTEL